MKVVAVLGSPKEDGDSSKLAREVLRGAADTGHEVVVYEINKMDVKGCQACGYCRTNNKDCRVKDDFQAYLKDLHTCGALVLSSPNYYAQVTGPMITFMNRHYCLSDKDGNSRLQEGIKLVGVFSQGNSDPNAYRANYDWFLSPFLKRKMVPAGIFIHAGGESLKPGSELMKRAYETGKAL